MPNDCCNILEIRGDEDELTKFKAFACRAADSRRPATELCFNNFVPRPPYEDENWYEWNIENWGTKWDAYDVGTKHVTDDSPEAVTDRHMKRASASDTLLAVLPSVITGRTHEEDGAANALPHGPGLIVTLIVDFLLSDNKPKDLLVYDMSTAWSPFSPRVLAAMSSRFPTLRFRHLSSERAAAFVARWQASGGVVTEQWEATVSSIKSRCPIDCNCGEDCACHQWDDCGCECSRKDHEHLGELDGEFGRVWRYEVA